MYHYWNICRKSIDARITQLLQPSKKPLIWRLSWNSQVGNTQYIVALRVAVINLDVWWTEGETRKNPPYWHNLNTIHMVVTYTIWDKSGQLSFFPSQFPSWFERFYLENLLKLGFDSCNMNIKTLKTLTVTCHPG